MEERRDIYVKGRSHYIRIDNIANTKLLNELRLILIHCGSKVTSYVVTLYKNRILFIFGRLAKHETTR